MVSLDDLDKFCVSWVVLQLSHAGIEPLLAGCNAHSLSSRNGGLPNVLAESTACLATDISHAISSTECALESFRSGGGTLTET